MRGDNDDIMKLFTFYNIKNQKFGRKHLLLLEGAITFTGLDMSNFLKKTVIIKRFYKFQPAVIQTIPSINVSCVIHLALFNICQYF